MKPNSTPNKTAGFENQSENMKSVGFCQLGFVPLWRDGVREGRNWYWEMDLSELWATEGSEKGSAFVEDAWKKERVVVCVSEGGCRRWVVAENGREYLFWRYEKIVTTIEEQFYQK